MRILIVAAAVLLAPASALAQAPTPARQRCLQGQQAEDWAIEQVYRAQYRFKNSSDEYLTAYETYKQELMQNPEFGPEGNQIPYMDGNAVQQLYNQYQMAQTMMNDAGRDVHAAKMAARQVAAQYQGCKLTKPPPPQP